jgi:hypothetical protein
MTTRQNISRRFYQATFAFAGVGFIFAFWQQDLSVRDWGDPTRTVVAAAMIAGYIIYRWRSPCARCGRPLGRFALFYNPWFDGNTSTHCVHCGESIDRDIAGKR